MKTHTWFACIWNIVSQWLSQISLSPTVRRCTLYLAVCTLAFGLCIVSVAAVHSSNLSAIHSQIVSTLHQMTQVPFGGPWP